MSNNTFEIGDKVENINHHSRWYEEFGEVIPNGKCGSPNCDHFIHNNPNYLLVRYNTATCGLHAHFTSLKKI